MKKKKLVIFMLVLVMILALAATALVGCHKDDPDDNPVPENYKTMSTALSKALDDALYNTVAEHNVTALKASAQLDVSTKYGDTEKAYTIKFGANVALNLKDNEKTSFGLSIVDKKASNANILNLYYMEDEITEDVENDPVGSGYLYVDLGTDKHFVINALSLKSVLQSQVKVRDKDGNLVTDKDGNPVDFEIDGDAVHDDVYDGISGILEYLDLVGEFGGIYQANDNSNIMLRLQLSTIFEQADMILQALSAIDDYTNRLGLDLKSSDIATLLPDLSIDILFNMKDAGNDKFDDAVFTGMSVNINSPKKDIQVKRTDGTDFVRVNIAKDAELDLALKFGFGADAETMPRILVSSDKYELINAINFTAAGELQLNEALGVSIDISGNKFDINIPKGTYNLSIGADIDPVQLIGMQFKANSTSAILDLISSLVNNVVKSVSIKIENPDDPTMKIDIAIRNGNVYLTDLSLIGDLGVWINSLIPASGVSIDTALNAIKGFLPADTPKDENTGSGNASGNTSASGNASGNGSGATASGDDDAWVPVVAEIVNNLTIIVNNGVASVELKNQSVAQNHKFLYEDENKKVPIMENGEHKYVDLGDTTLDVKGEINSNGLTLDAVLNNLVTDQDSYDKDNQTSITAKIQVNNSGITITAKSTNLSIKDIGELPIDLVIKLTSFQYGNANKAA